MRVIFFNAYFEPEIAASLYLYSNIAEDLVADGHEAIIFAPTPTRGVTPATRRIYSAERRSESSCGGRLQIRRLPLPRERKHPALRAARYFLMEGLFLAVGLFGRYDIAFLYSTPPTQGALAAALRILRKKPVLYNVQDLFPESLGSTGLTRPGSVTWRIGAALQRLTYRHVDKIVTISHYLKRQIVASGVSPERIEVVQNWVDQEEVFPVPRDENTLIEKYGLDRDKIFVTYCGNIGHSQNLGLLAEVAKEMQSCNNVEFIVIGDGAARTELADKIKQLRNVRILPFQPYDLIAHVFSLGDISLIISKRGVGGNSVPSKAWSIMAASRPIVASFDVDSELTAIVAETESGVVTPPDDKLALFDAIRQLVEDEEKRKTLGSKGRDFVLHNLTRRPSTDKYIRILESLASEELVQQ